MFMHWCNNCGIHVALGPVGNNSSHSSPYAFATVSKVETLCPSRMVLQITDCSKLSKHTTHDLRFLSNSPMLPTKVTIYLLFCWTSRLLDVSCQRQLYLLLSALHHPLLTLCLHCKLQNSFFGCTWAFFASYRPKQAVCLHTCMWSVNMAICLNSLLTCLNSSGSNCTTLIPVFYPYLSTFPYVAGSFRLSWIKNSSLSPFVVKGTLSPFS